MKFLNFASVIWFVAMLCVFIFSPPLTDVFFLFFDLGCLEMVAIGFVLVLWAIFETAKGRQNIAALVLCIAGLAGYYSIGFDVGRHVLFELRRPHYEQLLANANRTGKVDARDGHVDAQSPGKFAFYWQRGIMDNWVAVIHDSTHKIAGINATPKPTELIPIFGGEYYHCQDMGGGWYICWFT